MEWTVGTTEQHAARCSTTRASPRRSASSRPPVVTMIKTAFSPIAVLIVGLPRPVKPHGAREKGEHDQCIRAEASLPQKDEQSKHEDRGELQPSKLGDALEQRVERRLPSAVHRLRDMQVEARERACGDGDRQRDERDADKDDSE